MERPAPLVTPDCMPLWQGLQAGELRLQRCVPCRHWIHFPEPRCPRCTSDHFDFEAVSGRGEIETYTEIARGFVPGFDPPYIVAWVSLPEQAGLRVLANIINARTGDIGIGTPVELCIEDRPGFGPVPQFQPLSGGRAE